MSNFRIIGKISLLNGIAVQSYKYKHYLPIGKPEIIVEYLNRWGIDEIMLFDIKNSILKSNYLKNNLKDIIKNCNTPVTVGGGIQSIKDVEFILRNGADKVIINSALIRNIDLLKQIVDEYGSQAVVCSIDYKYENNKFNIYSYSRKENKNIDIYEYLIKLIDNGIGEILVNSIENNGQKNGLDFKFIDKYRKLISCPLIVSCGVNNYNHILKAINKNLDAVAIGNCLNHFEHSVILLKKMLKQIDKNKYIRLDTDIKYKNSNINLNNRLNPISDLNLKKMNKAY